MDIFDIGSGNGGAMNALLCADLALAGITSGILCGQVIDAVCPEGDGMPAAMRDPDLGGLAAASTGRHIADRFYPDKF